MEIHLLDMGTTKYGDCILITNNKKSILIDGGHPGDDSRIASQLKKLLKQNPPFKPDLLIVTHCHSDHIGCLPALVAAGDLQPKMALLADPKIGFAENGTAGASDAQKTINVALQEEDHSDLPDDELEQFLFDAARLQDKYADMIKTLKKSLKGSLFFYTGVDDPNVKKVENNFKELGLKILGPTKGHLKLCADLLKKSKASDLIDNFSDITDDVEPSSLGEIYRTLTRKIAQDAIGEQDRPGPGAAKNDQSIVVSVSSDGWSALLTADMQFAKAEVPGLSEEMKSLLKKVNDQGPYDFIKLSHHSSYNGLDDKLLGLWSESTQLFAHSGGTNDTTHPDPGVLDILKAKKGSLNYARTDRNGLISVIKKSGELQMAISKGRFNDFTPNTKKDEAAKVETKEPTATTGFAQPEVEVFQQESTSGIVEVITKVPHESTRVTITIDIDAQKKKTRTIDQTFSVNRISNTDHTRYTGLLFVTCSDKLELNIGKQEASGIMKFLTSIPGASSVNVGATWTLNQIAEAVHGKLGKATKGVVVVGGYDVIPAQQLDVLDLDLRRRVVDDGYEGYDADDFIVWSDDYLVDIDGDSVPEYPLSRIPDGRSAELLVNAFKANPHNAGMRFGVRNIARPFAESVYSLIPGPLGVNIGISKHFSPKQVQPNSASGSVYFMLHGSDTDGTTFWGEEDGGSPYEAFNIANVPNAANGTIVFSGCCWGALTALPIASRKPANVSIRPRTPEQSLALSYIKAGALAFVGCTGSHYSPSKKPYKYFGQPMHDFFWQGIKDGYSPSLALFKAREKYASGMPFADNQSFNEAVEMKIFRQFVCLGVGW
ncbi:MAG TPA: MBL fold metallo-hydrolase [Ohtaekwangia sp.]|uniref:MBL fold metallo-hydrolase n=1 Tax=Ohtaekwangia sp. TaxID=2066019 RepID=UPI002F94DBBF